MEPTSTCVSIGVKSIGTEILILVGLGALDPKALVEYQLWEEGEIRRVPKKFPH